MIDKDERHLIASAEDQEEKELIEKVEEVEVEIDIREIHENISQEIKEDLSINKMVPVTRVEVEVEVHKREVLENISKEVKEDLTRTKMVPDEEWTKTLNSSDSLRC